MAQPSPRQDVSRGPAAFATPLDPRLRHAGMTALGILFLSSCVFAVEVKPVVNAQVLGGQYYYNGTDSDLGALASLAASPYIKFNDRWSLVPLYSGSYQGTKQV